MAEPKNKNSSEWREWNARHALGGSCVESIKSAIKKGEGEQLLEFIAELCGISFTKGDKPSAFVMRNGDSLIEGPKGIVQTVFQFKEKEVKA